jgi:hypothetical protein
VPLSIRLVLGALELCVGLTLLVVAALGARSQLPKNGWLGVRTAATMRTDEAFALANRVAAVPLGAAGAITMVGGAALLAGLDGPLAWVVLGISVLGCLVLAGIGGTVGDRAAAAVPRPAARPESCSGQCAGCVLVDGCQPAEQPG